MAPLLLHPLRPLELDLWLRALLLCMDQLFPSQNDESGHQPVLCGLAGQHCSHCGRLFAGRLGQGYRCRVCPVQLHKACLAEQVGQEEVGGKSGWEAGVGGRQEWVGGRRRW